MCTFQAATRPFALFREKRANGIIRYGNKRVNHLHAPGACLHDSSPTSNEEPGDRLFFILYKETLGHHMLDEKAHLSPKVWKPFLHSMIFFGRELARIPARMAEVGL